MDYGVLQMIQDSQFGGHPSENPHTHIKKFAMICDMKKQLGVFDDVASLKLFPFSLKDKALDWVDSLPHNSITNWEELTDVGIIDAQIGGEFIMKYDNKTYELLEKIAKNTHLWSSPRGLASTQKKQAAEMYDLNSFNMINAKFDALTNMLAKKIVDLSILVNSSPSRSS
ncbi:uncharacterized protein LOC110638601 [Hevea brasiliensis]|uniref:uncharacterized protein LOC110638601 n=1 Tax=Hevea brasiliensis TaxID=3981 RepID=UPI0025DA722E|nr:uncharacterized protein LOC110638601 [Hevea brasiliensis]